MLDARRPRRTRYSRAFAFFAEIRGISRTIPARRASMECARRVSNAREATMEHRRASARKILKRLHARCDEVARSDATAM
jgi:hypothetical protein